MAILFTLRVFARNLLKNTFFYIGSAKYLFFFFFENALKKTTEYFLKFLFFYLKVQASRLTMENNFIQMAASAGHAVVYTIGPAF